MQITPQKMRRVELLRATQIVEGAVLERIAVGKESFLLLAQCVGHIQALTVERDTVEAGRLDLLLACKELVRSVRHTLDGLAGRQFAVPAEFLDPLEKDLRLLRFIVDKEQNPGA